LKKVILNSFFETFFNFWYFVCQAAELDGSDVTLWYRIGTVADLVIDYELACDAFLEVIFLPNVM
jgi:hypothetical protein